MGQRFSSEGLNLPDIINSFNLIAAALALYLASMLLRFATQKVDYAMAIMIAFLAMSPLHNYLVGIKLYPDFWLTIFIQALPIYLLPIGLIFIHHLAASELKRWQASLYCAPVLAILVIFGYSIFWPHPNAFVIFYYISLSYLILYVGLLFWHRQRLWRLLIEFQNSAACWMLYQVLGMVMMAGIKLLILHALFQFNSVIHPSWLISEALIAGYLGLACLFYLWQPPILQGDSRTAKSNDIRIPNTSSNTNTPADVLEVVQEKPTHRLELTESIVQALSQQLHHVMQTEKIAQHEGSDAKLLAGHLGISVQQLSELLNVHLNSSFYDLLNDYRLLAAEVLLNDPKCALSILDIAFTAGFNNKNSFYQSFRKKHHCTPGQFRKQSAAS